MWSISLCLGFHCVCLQLLYCTRLFGFSTVPASAVLLLLASSSILYIYLIDHSPLIHLFIVIFCPDCTPCQTYQKKCMHICVCAHLTVNL